MIHRVKNYNLLYKIAANKKVISFDIFDTLIKRNCNKPIDIFEIVQNRYNANNDETISNFISIRIEAEKKARNVSKKEEVNLDEIYSFICFKPEIVQKLKKIEIETEIDYCCKNDKIYDFYLYCKKHKKKIICTSDMYLDRETISRILTNNGYEVDDIFVSSEVGYVKFTGGLFRHILDVLKVDKRELVHIGDSYKADLIAPLKLGIAAYHIKKKEKNLSFVDIRKSKTIASNIMLSLINNKVSQFSNYYEKVGYEIIGPLCCQFVLWINDIAHRNNFSNLLFCARDMKMIQEIYNNFYGDKIRNNYFYVSRKSTYLPYLYINQDYEKFKELIPIIKRKLTISELLNMYNISIENIDENLKKYELDANVKYDMSILKNNKNFISFYNDIVINIIEEKGKEQYKYFMNYLSTLKVDENTAIIDLGWRGTTQKILIDINKQNINGLYLGLYSKNDKYLNNNYWTFLFNEKGNTYSLGLSPFLTLIETLFSALHGSVKLYSSSEDKPYILGSSINEKNELIINIQNGALQFCKDIKKYIDDLEYTDDIFINSLINIGINPTMQQAKNFGNIYTDNVTIRFMAKPRNLLYYIFHIKKLKNDILDSEWTIGFMKRLFLIKLPYFKIYNFYKKRYTEK